MCKQNRLKITGVLILLGMSLNACGLKFVPSASLEELEKARRSKLEEQLSSDFSTIGKKYTSLTFGESVVVKPLSYQRLDSLFEVKYQRSQNRLSSVDLDPLIEQQKMVLLADTTEVLYMETHWFELMNDSLAEYLISRCYVNNKNVLRKMEIVSQFTTSKANQIWARKYMKEEWFVRDLGYTTQEESNFFTKMKNKEFELSDASKNIFLDNVFRVMRIANENKSLQVLAICVKLAAEDFKQSFPDFKKEEYTFSYRKEMDTTTNEVYYIVEAVSQKNPSIIYLQQYDSLFIPQY